MSCRYKDTKHLIDGSGNIDELFTPSQREAKYIEELEAKISSLELQIFNQKAFAELPIRVLNAVFSEIEYQNDKWGEQHNRNQTVEGHLLILRKELIEAEDGWMKNLTGRNSVESEITQVAAVAVQALINLHNAGRL